MAPSYWWSESGSKSVLCPIIFFGEHVVDCTTIPNLKAPVHYGRVMMDHILLSTSQSRYLYSTCSLCFTKKRQWLFCKSLFSNEVPQLHGWLNTSLLQKQNSLSTLHGSYNNPRSVKLPVLYCTLWWDVGGAFFSLLLQNRVSSSGSGSYDDPRRMQQL